MRAMQLVENNKPLEMRDIAQPTPGPGEVVIKVATCGLNFGDLLIIKGSYQEKPPLPATLGMELAGTVTAVADDISHIRVGQRVASYSGFGGLAEYAAIPAEICVPIPDTMNFIDAAAFLVAYGTSHVGLDYKAQLKPGERLLVLGASGGVGLTAVELGKVMGAEVIACARGAEKLEICRQMGADHLINSETDDIRAIVKSLGGADVVYDPVGGDQFTQALRATNPEGRMIPLGFASGDVPQIPANIVLVKNITVLGLYWGGYARLKPSVLTDSFAALFDMHAAGKLKPHVSNVLPLAQANEALDLLRTRKATGKVVVEVNAA